MVVQYYYYNPLEFEFDELKPALNFILLWIINHIEKEKFAINHTYWNINQWV